MVAPNGARRGRDVHPAIPLTDDEVVETAKACFAAGAGGIHAHIRDDNGIHLLDAGRYQALLDRLTEAVPGMYLQVTSESGDIYDAATQQRIMRELKPQNVSVALREMVRQPSDWAEAERFYDWAASENVAIQHIVYAPEELQQFLDAVDRGAIPGNHHLLQFVLGSYDGTKISKPEGVSDFADMLPDEMSFDWMLCAFGREESSCLVETLRQGGKARIGFENSLWNADGTLATSNAERVAELVAMSA